MSTVCEVWKSRKWKAYLDLIKVVTLRHSANANYSIEILHIIFHYSTVYCGQPFQELTFLIW